MVSGHAESENSQWALGKSSRYTALRWVMRSEKICIIINYKQELPSQVTSNTHVQTYFASKLSLPSPGSVSLEIFGCLGQSDKCPFGGGRGKI